VRNVNRKAAEKEGSKPLQREEKKAEKREKTKRPKKLGEKMHT
jgi:hypothetical protein